MSCKVLSFLLDDWFQLFSTNLMWAWFWLTSLFYKIKVSAKHSCRESSPTSSQCFKTWCLHLLWTSGKWLKQTHFTATQHLFLLDGRQDASWNLHIFYSNGKIKIKVKTKNTTARCRTNLKNILLVQCWVQSCPWAGSLVCVCVCVHILDSFLTLRNSAMLEKYFWLASATFFSAACGFTISNPCRQENRH